MSATVSYFSRYALCVVGIVMAVPTAARAQTPASAASPTPVVTPAGILVDFQDAELRYVISALAEAAGTNVVYGDLPPKRITLRLRQPVAKENILALLRSLA